MVQYSNYCSILINFTKCIEFAPLQELYAVKWYKNGLEFYRFLPSSAKATTIYARPGVNVDPGRSGDREVTLTGLGQQSTGRYRCEVSTEAPSFATVSNYGDMVVVGKWRPNILATRIKRAHLSKRILPCLRLHY